MENSVIFCLLIIAFSAGTIAGMHFTFTSNTGNNMTVLIKKTSALGLEKGDEVGTFINGRCVGATMWEGKNAAITVWGDNEQTSSIDGALPGGKLEFRIWKNKANKEYTAEACYEKGKQYYSPDGITIVSSLNSVVEGDKGADRTAEVKTDNEAEKSAETKNAPEKEVNVYLEKKDAATGFLTAGVDQSLSMKHKTEDGKAVAARENVPQLKKIDRTDSAQLLVLSPSDSAMLYTDSIVLLWSFKNTKKKLRNFYTEVADNPLMNNVEIDSTTFSSDTTEIIRSLQKGTYWWRIRLILDGGKELKSPIRVFTVIPLSIYPNSYTISWQPFNHQKKQYALSFMLSRSSPVKFKIANSSGKQVYRLKKNMHAGNNVIDISIDTLAKGTYSYDLKTEDYSVHGKFLLEN